MTELDPLVGSATSSRPGLRGWTPKFGHERKVLGSGNLSFNVLTHSLTYSLSLSLPHPPLRRYPGVGATAARAEESPGRHRGAEGRLPTDPACLGAALSSLGGGMRSAVGRDRWWVVLQIIY